MFQKQNIFYSPSIRHDLLASTALVMSAGVAAADVALSGDARMGLIYNGDDVLMTSRARVTFTMSGETDSGLAFGATFRADQNRSAGVDDDTRMTGGTVFVSGDFGKLTMGDVASAARAAVGDLYATSLTGLGDLNEMAYLDRAGMGGFYTGFDRRTAALYEYSIDGFTGYAYIGQNNVLRFPGLVVRDRLAAIGVKYSMDGFTGALGYEASRASATGFPSFSASHLIGSLEYSMDGFKAKAIAGRVGGDLGTALAGPGTRRTQYGLSVEGSFDATTVTAFANRNFATTDYGIGASYDLGGGAKIVGGIARNGSNGALGITSQTVADFGLAFTF